MQDLLSVAARAERLGVAARTIYNRRHEGLDLPPAIEIGSRVLFDPVDVQAWLDKKKQPTAPLDPHPDTNVKRRAGRPTKAESLARRKAAQEGA